MNVAQLIAHLQTLPSEMLVVRSLWSEQVLLEPIDVTIITACAPRCDGWVQNLRPDKPGQPYVCIG